MEAMTKTVFDTLRVYELAEELADRVWEVVTRWDRLPQNTIRKQLVNSPDSNGQLTMDVHL
jgi:hypothetical protein